MWTQGPARWDTRSGSSKHVSHVELWSRGEPVTRNAPFYDGAVTHELKSGYRRSLSLQVPQLWEQWFRYPALEVRPYRGRDWGTSSYECPMGVFRVRLDELNDPGDFITLNANDNWRLVEDFDFTTTLASYRGSSREVIKRLIHEVNVGRVFDDHYTSETQVPETNWDNRAKATLDLVQAAASWVYFNRTGTPVLEAQTLGPVRTALKDGPEGNYLTAKLSPQWDDVYNVVSAYSSNNEVQFEAAIVSVVDSNHPASPARLGTRRVKRFASPLFADRDQAFKAANTILASSSALAEAYDLVTPVDARRDSGDTFPLTSAKLGLSGRLVQAVKVVTPLRGGNQQVRAVAV